jgi:flagellar hook-associated protein 1 FlgK
MTAIPASSTLPSKFPGHLEPITSITGVTAGGPSAPATGTATNNITAPYYAGNIQLSPTISARALQVGDIYKSTSQDNNAGAAQSAAAALINQVMNFATSGITGSQTLQNGAAAMTVGIGQDLSTTNNKITELTTAATQIQQAIAPDSEVNLDTEMSKLVVLQTAYQANAKVVTTVANLLDTLINLPT